MMVYWRERKKGQRLILVQEEGSEEIEVGGVRETKRGFDAFAKTFGYDPGRADRRAWRRWKRPGRSWSRSAPGRCTRGRMGSASRATCALLRGNRRAIASLY